jgi:hypothetical protein
VKKLLFTFLIVTFLPVMAYYPSVDFKFKNVKIKTSHLEEYQNKFLEFLKEYPDVLRPEGKKYKQDQSCTFSLDLDEDGKFLIETIKVEKMGKNIGYNLKAIEFLRNNPIKLVKRNPDKPIFIEMKYLAF